MEEDTESFFQVLITSTLPLVLPPLSVEWGVFVCDARVWPTDCPGFYPTQIWASGR